MRKRRERKNVWAEYERRKRDLSRKPLSPAQYELAIQKIARELKA